MEWRFCVQAELEVRYLEVELISASGLPIGNDGQVPLPYIHASYDCNPPRFRRFRCHCLSVVRLGVDGIPHPAYHCE